MRAAVAFAVVLAIALGTTSAAASLAIRADARPETPLRPGEDHLFSLPFIASRGAVYAKVVPTPGNAVHDGTRANGTLEPPSGWRVAFAILRADGTRDDLGARVDSEPSASAEMAEGEAATWEITVHAAPDARAPATVHVALALRAPAAAGGSSGAVQDEAASASLRFVVAPEELDAPLGALAAIGALGVALVICRRSP